MKRRTGAGHPGLAASAADSGLGADLPLGRSSCSRLGALLSAVAVVCLACAPPPASDETPAPPDALLRLERLLAPKSFDAPQLSPDGRWIAYLGMLDGVSNFFVAPTDDPTAARPLTHREGRGIQARDVSGQVMWRWSEDGRSLLYPLDRDGDERWNLFTVDVATGSERNLTRLDGGQVAIVATDPTRPRRILISITEDLLRPDLYELDLDSGERKSVQRSDGYLAFIADRHLRPRLALRFAEDGGLDFDRATPGGSWEPLLHVPEEDVPAISASGYQKIGRFDAEERRYYLYDSRGRNTAALVALELTSGAAEPVAADPRVDLGGVLYHPTEHRPQAFATAWTRTEWHALDEAIAPDLERLAGAAGSGTFEVVSRSNDDRRWIVRFVRADRPEAYRLYERPEATLRDLFVATPELEGLHLSDLYPVEVHSRDGLELVSYLSYPPWIPVDGRARPATPLPLVLLVHGGPSDERAQYAFGPFVHWLNNRGYGVFYVNFRGSPGFGKDFLNAQRGEWGGRMHDDLVDQVEWAIAEGVTEPGRIAILGGSYGGYAALVGMTRTPDLFACGVDLVGPSTLEIFMPHWDVDQMSSTLGGDPRTDEGRRFLRSRSPLHLAARATHPILIGQGANDSRVPQSQSDAMVDVLEQHGVAVTYVLYPDEGHGLLRPANSYSFWAITEVFLTQCLGGRSAPLGDRLEGSSAQVLAGAEHVPGLVEALARREAAGQPP